MAKILEINGLPLKINGHEVYEQVSSGVVKQVDVAARKMTIIGTDETVDRDGDVIEMKGWQLENYRKNPVFLWAHNYGSVPLARSEKIIKRKDPLRMEHHLLYPTKGLYPFADMILELYGEYIINASSVGFIPFEWDNIEQEGERQENTRHTWGKRFKKQELLELSGCAVPSNPNALQDALKGKSFLNMPFEEVQKWLQGQVQPPRPDHVDDIMGELDLKADYVDETKPFTIQIPKNLCVVEEEGDKEPIFTEEEEISRELVDKPYPNEHACRLEDPDKYDRFARKNCYRKHDNKCIDFIFGVKDNKSETQAMRYDKEVWTVASAKAHCKAHDGAFEAAKELEGEEIKGIGGARDLPLDESASWDGNAAVGRMRILAGGPDKDKIDWAKYKKGFVWFNEEDKENFGSYKLPFADVKDGKLTAIWGGVANAMRVVLGARGGVSISDADKKKCHSFLASYYKKFDKPVPEMSSMDALMYLLVMGIEDIDDYIRSAIKEVLEAIKSKKSTGVDLANKPIDQDSIVDTSGKNVSETILEDAFEKGKVASSPAPTPIQYDFKGVITELKDLRESLKSLKGE